MKLVDILARELKVWPEGCSHIVQDHDGQCWPSAGDISASKIVYGKEWSTDDDGVLEFYSEIASDFGSAKVTRAEWQAAVDALNAPKVVEWDGIGDPPVGTVCEYDARPVGRGDPLFVTVEVKYVSDQSIVIICTDVPDGENKENIGVELALMNGISMRRKLRAIRTAEQVAAEEREKAIREMASTPKPCGHALYNICADLYDAGYRKQVAK